MTGEPAAVRPTIRRLVGYLRPHWRAQTVAVVASLVAVASDLPIPLLIKVLVDDVATAGQLDLLASALAGIGALAVVQAAASITSDYLFTTAGQQAVNVLRADLMQHVLRLPLSYFRRRRTGETVTHFTSDCDAVAEVYQSGYGAGVAAVVQVVGIISVVAVIDWRFGVAAAGLVPVYMVLPLLLRRQHIQAGARVQAAVGNLGGLATELIAGTRDIRAFNGELWSIRRLRRTLREVLDARVYEGIVGGWTLVTASIYWLTYAVIFGLVAEPIFRGELTIGFALAMAWYFTRLDLGARPLMTAYAELQRSVGAASRLFRFLDTPGESPGDGGASSMVVTRGEIAFRGVSAAYDTGRAVLHDVSFTAGPGHVTALVGPSGGGKSTIVNLLLRFLRPSAGRIEIDGQNIAAVDAAAVRRHIGVVFQDAVLFDGSIADNIRFGRHELRDEAIEAAARTAGLDEFVQSSARGYATPIGERGLRLSGGQAQRVALARAIAAQPPILVLDEATASLDAESEQSVLHSMAEAARGRTTFVVAHRLSTARAADHIIVLDEGRVIDGGSHEELYQRCRLYRKLCDLQMTQPDEVSA